MNAREIIQYKTQIFELKAECSRLNKLITLDISNGLNADEKTYVNLKIANILPRPKKLILTNLKKCDFCFNNDDLDTFTHQLSINFGFQICEKCNNSGKQWPAAIKHSLKHKCVGAFDFRRWWTKEHFFNSLDELYKCNLFIYRSNNTIERWYMAVNATIFKKNEIIFTVTDGILTKQVKLSELSELNPEIHACESEIREKFNLYTN